MKLSPDLHMDTLTYIKQTRRNRIHKVHCKSYKKKEQPHWKASKKRGVCEQFTDEETQRPECKASGVHNPGFGPQNWEKENRIVEYKSHGSG